MHALYMTYNIWQTCTLPKYDCRLCTGIHMIYPWYTELDVAQTEFWEWYSCLSLLPIMYTSCVRMWSASRSSLMQCLQREGACLYKADCDRVWSHHRISSSSQCTQIKFASWRIVVQSICVYMYKSIKQFCGDRNEAFDIAQLPYKYWLVVYLYYTCTIATCGLIE